MKKKLGAILLVVALVLALALPAAPAAAHLEGAPFTTELLAGQDIPVGTVSVWNDSEELHVKYQTTDGWMMTETHLEVATDLAAIPQTTGGKKGGGTAGNPIPGQFARSVEHDPAVTEWEEVFNLVAEGWTPCTTDLVIAAHAAVQKLSDVITASFATGDGIDTVQVIAEDPLNLNHPVGYPGLYGGTSSPAVPTWVHGSWPSIAGAQWISSALYVENPPPNSWRLFTRNFSVPSNAVNLSGTLQITSDNAEEVELNGTPVGIDGEVYGPFTDDQEWNTILSHAVSPQPGPNMLEVMVRNYAGSSSPTDNPTGLIYKMDYEYQLLRTETAWGDGTRFTERGNWATYFTYHVQPWLDGTGGSTADWVIDSPAIPAHTGDYYYHLETAGDVGSGNEARIVIDLPDGTTLGDIDSISWWVWAATGYPPHVDIYLDVDEDNVVDDEDVLTAEMYYNNADPVFGLVAWCNQKVQYDIWLQTFELTSPDGFGTVDDTTLLWLCKLGGGPGDAPAGTLAQWKAGVVGSDNGSDLPLDNVITGSAPVLYIEIEVDNWMLQSEAYVDDIAIDLGP